MGTAEIACWALPAARGQGMITTAVSAVLRFGFGGLGLHRLEYQWAEGNAASARVARSAVSLRGPQALGLGGRRAAGGPAVAARLADD